MTIKIANFEFEFSVLLKIIIRQYKNSIGLQRTMRGHYALKVNIAALAIAAASLAIQFKSLRLLQQMAASTIEVERAQLAVERIEFEARKKELTQSLSDQTAKLEPETQNQIILAIERAKANANANVNANTTNTTSVSTPELPEIKKSNVFDFVSDYINSFSDYVGTLDFIHTYALVNLLVLKAVCLCLLHIFFLGYSDYFITKFKLESRFPKFASLLKTRSLITTGSLFAYTLVLVCLLFFGIFINIVVLSFL